MRTLISKIIAWWLMRHATVETTTNWATVAQLMFEYEQLDSTEKKKMLEWAKDPENPNPNAIYFYRNVTRFGK